MTHGTRENKEFRGWGRERLPMFTLACQVRLCETSSSIVDDIRFYASPYTAQTTREVKRLSMLFSPRGFKDIQER